MDSLDEARQIDQERRLGPAECGCDGTCELAFTLGGEIHHYRDVWGKIEDQHYAECPMSIAAAKKLRSSCCMCGPLEKALKDAKIDEDAECQRCRMFGSACKCGSKSQLV